MTVYRARTIAEGLAFPEAPRWHAGRLWLTDQHARAVLAMEPAGGLETIVETDDLPGGLGWLPDGRLLVVLMTRRQVAQLSGREFNRRGLMPDVSRSAGKIISMSSVHDVIPWAGHVNYAASKGGLMMFVKSLAQEVAHQKIRVNAISPGAIRTNINRVAWETPEAEAELLRLIPYERIGDPMDIGQVAVWLASDASDYVTGTTIYVDGGMILYPGFREGG